MSNIPYVFRPIPEEFLTDDFLDDPLMMRLIRYIMKQISPHPQKIPLKNKKKILELEPFEFMYGRKACMKQTGLTERNARTRIVQLVELFFVEKVSIKSSSTYSVYRLVTGSFIKNNVQQNVTQTVQHTVQHSDHNVRNENKNDSLSFLKETNKEKTKIVRPSFRSSLLYEDQIQTILLYCETKNIHITQKDLSLWFKKHDEEKILATINLLLTQKKQVINQAKWLQNALSEDFVGKALNLEKNKFFCEEFKRENKWKDLTITKQYCRIESLGIDFHFWWHQDKFREELTRKFQTLKEAQ